jgi:hypothetical protein
MHCPVRLHWPQLLQACAAPEEFAHYPLLPCPPAPCSCVKKSGACGCSRRRSLQGSGYQQCDCCADMLCVDNSTNTGTICAGPPSDPGFGEITDRDMGSGFYAINITLIASNETGADGLGEAKAFNTPWHNRWCWIESLADMQRVVCICACQPRFGPARPPCPPAGSTACYPCVPPPSAFHRCCRRCLLCKCCLLWRSFSFLRLREPLSSEWQCADCCLLGGFLMSVALGWTPWLLGLLSLFYIWHCTDRSSSSNSPAYSAAISTR